MSKQEKGIAKSRIVPLGTADVPSMLAQVEQQIAELTGSKGDDNEKDILIDEFGHISGINSPEDILRAGSVIIAKERAYNEAITAIVPKGITPPAFNVDGVTVKTALQRLSVRYGEIYNADKIKDLKEVKKMLEENLSAEMKLAKTLEKIQAKLG